MRAAVTARRLGTCFERAAVTGVAASGAAVVASGWFRPGQFLPHVGTRQESEDFADGGSGLVGSGSGTGAWTW